MGGSAVGRRWGALRQQLFEPVDAASLGAFRIMFGWLVVWQVFRAFIRGHIWTDYIQPRFHFTYLFFDWVRPLPGEGMYDFFLVLALCGALVCVGFCYRPAIILVFLGGCYMFLVEQALYLNHMYLFCLVAFLMCFISANRWASLDGQVFRWPEPATVPFWQLFLLRAQMFLVYFYAGVAKLNGDWLRAVPVRDWAMDRSDSFLIGPLLAHEATAWAIAYLGIAYDLSIGFLLLCRRTRPLAILASLMFHGINKLMYDIGIFPEFAFAMTLLFLEPDWPRRVLAFFGRMRDRFFPVREDSEQEVWDGADEWDDSDEWDEGKTRERPSSPVRSQHANPREVAKAEVKSPVPADPAPAKPPSGTNQAWVLAFVGSYLAVQVLLPLRHWLYPGDVNWTEEGHRFSWRMKLREKKGELEVKVRDPATGREWKVDPKEHLASWQRTKAATRPDMTQQFARYVHDLYQREKGITHPEVYCRARCALNDSVEGDLVDPAVNLAAEPRNLWPKRWILHQRPPRRATRGGDAGERNSGASAD